MQTKLGIVVGAAAIAGLAIWGLYANAQRVEARIGIAAQAIVAGSIHGASARVSGRVITFSGLVDTVEERETLLAALEDVPGQRGVRDDTTLVPTLSPYLTEAIKAADGTLTLGGSVPRAALGEALVEPVSGQMRNFQVAAGAPEGWQDVIGGGLRALAALQEGTLRLEDTHLSLAGVARDPAARDRMRAAIGTLPDGISFEEGPIILRDDGTPPDFTVSLAEDGSVSARGKLPEGVTSSDIAAALGREEIGGDAAPGLTGQADGAAVRAGVSAMSGMVEGKLHYDDGRLTFAGSVAKPEDRDLMLAALSDLPESYDVITDAVRVIDDGAPSKIVITLGADGTAELIGKLPAGLDVTAVAAALGVEALDSTAEQGFSGADLVAPMTAQLGVIAPFLVLSERVEITLSETAPDLDLLLRPGVRATAVEAALLSELPEATLASRNARVRVAEGTTRTNALTGQAERAAAGYWLPDIRFTPGPRACAARSEAAMRETKIAFVTGSTELEPLSVPTLERVAAIARRCVVEGGLVAEIGGHTDNVGQAIRNYELSYARAQAVSRALQLRGVPARGLRSIGYGSTAPVADNATEEGRAANRRTTILWTNLAQ